MPKDYETPPYLIPVITDEDIHTVSSKSPLRATIASQIEDFIKAGGVVQGIPEGVSGDVIRTFTKKELIDHHKRRTRQIRGCTRK